MQLPHLSALCGAVRGGLFHLALCWLIISSSFKVELPRVGFSLGSVETKAQKKKKKKKDAIFTGTSFVLSWAGPKLGEQAPRQHISLLWSFWGGKKARTEARAHCFAFWCHASLLTQLYLLWGIEDENGWSKRANHGIYIRPPTEAQSYSKSPCICNKI